MKSDPVKTDLDGHSCPKALPLEALAQVVADLKQQGKKIVWANGCFEILHAGHIEFFMQAARLGDVLIVGVNTDDSVRALKGDGHPLVSLAERLFVLAAVGCVNYLTWFSGLTCTQALRTLKPDVYAKGAKHLHSMIDPDEWAAIEETGGYVVVMPGSGRSSTSAIIDKVRNHP